MGNWSLRRPSDVCTANEPRRTNGRPEYRAKRLTGRVIFQASINRIVEIGVGIVGGQGDAGLAEVVGSGGLGGRDGQEVRLRVGAIGGHAGLGLGVGDLVLPLGGRAGDGEVGVGLGFLHARLGVGRGRFVGPGVVAAGGGLVEGGFLGGPIAIGLPLDGRDRHCRQVLGRGDRIIGERLRAGDRVLVVREHTGTASGTPVSRTIDSATRRFGPSPRI